MNFVNQINIGTWIVLAIIVVFIAVAVYVMATDDSPVNDETLLDFLDQTGYSVQRISDGWCAVTDGSHKMVGRPAQDVREAILSALDAVVTGEAKNNG